MILDHTYELENLEGDDIISTLPSHVLCHILSFIPTKFAVLTSILSKRWMDLFASVGDIDLDDTLLLHHGGSSFVVNPEDERPGVGQRFKLFVSKVLLARNSTNINRFRLFCSMKCEYSIISGWISDVLLLNVRDLDVNVRTEESCAVPEEIFSCRSLKSLKLAFGAECVLTVPESVILPNLKVLKLEFITFVGDDSVKKLFLGCPVLEKLEIFLCQIEDLETFEISLPSLKDLHLSYRSWGEIYVVLDTPSLQNLVCCLSEPSFFLVKNTKSLASARLACVFNGPGEEVEDAGYMLGESVSILMNENNHVKSLSLTFFSLAALYYSPCSLVKFQNLTYVELNTSDPIGYLLLPELLESCPNLVVLSFPEGWVCVHHAEKDIEYRLPESVPLCLSKSLKEIRIGDFNGREYEFELVEYFLENGGVLKKMMIGCDVHPASRMALRNPFKNFEGCPEWVAPTCDRLSEAPRSFEACEVVISWDEGCYWHKGENIHRRII